MSSTSTSVTGLQDSEVQAATSVAYPELPALSSACKKLVDLICSNLSKLPLPGISLIAPEIRKLVDSNALRLKELILNTLSKSHTEFSEICKNFSEAKGIKESFKALGNMFQWAIGKGFYGLSLACTKILGWLIACNDATIQHDSAKEWLTNLKRDFETVVTFEIGKTSVILSAGEPQADERQVAVTERAAPALQPTASLATESDATHDVQTREQYILEQIQQLLTEDVRTAIKEEQPLETENDMINYLLSLLNEQNVPERLLSIVSILRGDPQST
ncbi:MAG: hypothetical protein LBH52_04410 [Puniceicoccales bacterium]|jgi:hypothetical protein|nr:hypothetical protein [Puniceicoccales bacterium]